MRAPDTVRQSAIGAGPNPTPGAGVGGRNHTIVTNAQITDRETTAKRPKGSGARSRPQGKRRGEAEREERGEQQPTVHVVAADRDDVRRFEQRGREHRDGHGRDAAVVLRGQADRDDDHNEGGGRPEAVRRDEVRRVVPALADVQPARVLGERGVRHDRRVVAHAEDLVGDRQREHRDEVEHDPARTDEHEPRDDEAQPSSRRARAGRAARARGPPRTRCGDAP